MSDRPDHLIERAAARMRAANAALLRDPVNDSGSAGERGRGQPRDLVDDGPVPNMPTDRVAGFTPLVIPPPAQIENVSTDTPALAEITAAPGTLVAPRFAPTLQVASVPVISLGLPPTTSLAPSPATLPALIPPSLELLAAPVSFGAAVPEGVEGPIPAPAAPLTRPVRGGIPPAPPPALSINSAPTTVHSEAVNPLDMTQGARAVTMTHAPPVIQLDALERAGMVVARTTRTRISEEYRIAIGRILRTLHEASDVQGARNVLMVTSARPGEGKSFTALNLAGSIAQNGTDAVLLVDVDPKVRPLSDQLGLGEAQGFLDLVSDPSLRPEDLLHVTAIPNLAIMPVGTRLGGRAQTIVGTASMRPIIPTISRLARRFPKHLIMLDTPPCLSTSDPHTLAPHVGQIVLVVEAERTQRSEVEAAVDLVRVCPTITMLLNKVRMTTSHTFGAYDYFGSYT